MKQKEYVMNDKVLPYFGNTPINEITAPMIRKWQGEMMEKGLILPVNPRKGFINRNRAFLKIYVFYLREDKELV